MAKRRSGNALRTARAAQIALSAGRLTGHAIVVDEVFGE